MTIFEQCAFVASNVVQNTPAQVIKGQGLTRAQGA